MHAVFGCIVVNWNNLKIDDKWKWLKSLIYEQVNRYEFDPRQRRLLTQQGAGESQQLNRLHRERKKKRKRKRESAIKKKKNNNRAITILASGHSHLISLCVSVYAHECIRYTHLNSLSTFRRSHSSRPNESHRNAIWYFLIPEGVCFINIGYIVIPIGCFDAARSKRHGKE